VTVLTSETQLTWGTTATLPRVNLLPPEIAEKRAFRRIQFALGASVLGAVVVVGMLYVGATSSVSHAQSDLSASQATQTQLQGQVAKFADVTAVYAAAAAAQASLTSAMGDEVRYSQLLNDLSLTIPDNVWLSNLSYVAVPPSAAGAAAGATSTAVGTLSASGTAFSHDDVAVLLESLMGLKTYANSYFTSSTESLLGKRKVVTYTVTADVTPAAESGRYTKPVGG
jgi:Tfp pilus assembly protein PilN